MRILLGVTGGIAAYKSLEFARLAVKAGHSVRVVQTPASLRFVGRSSFAAITGAPVLVSEFESDPARGSWPGQPLPEHQPISHLAVVEGADLFVVAPATANSLSRLAAGAGEDLVTTSALAAECPVLLAPAMNGKMWSNPATVENVAKLRDRGFVVLDPIEGQLASHGEHGRGRLVEPADLLSAAEAHFKTSPAQESSTSNRLAGCNLLISAGGTREPIDEVRFLGNRSSGRMGLALANAAVELGANVTLVVANPQVPLGEGFEAVEVKTAAEMSEALQARFDQTDVLIMAAAVADFRPVHRATGKIDKSDGVPEIQLQSVPDIVAGLARQKRQTQPQLIVGFAAEHGLDVDRARAKLVRKKLDLIVFNDISNPAIGFDSDQNAVTVIGREHLKEIPLAEKSTIAAGILDQIERVLAGSQFEA